MPLLKTLITEEYMELVIGSPENEDSMAVGVIEGVDAEEPHIYMRVMVETSVGDPVGDVQLAALKAARELIGAEITRLTKLQQAR